MKKMVCLIVAGVLVMGIVAKCSEDYINDYFYGHQDTTTEYKTEYKEENQESNTEYKTEYKEENNYISNEKTENKSITETVIETVEQKQALKKAEQYIDIMGFSKEGMRSQLKYEGFTNSEIEYAIDMLY